MAAGCSGSDGATDATDVTDVSGSSPSTVDEAAHVRVLGLWSGPELDSFNTVKAAWEQDTGKTVDWTGARDLTGELQAQIAAGTPPDIAILPNVGLLHELVADGQLVPLSSVLDVATVEADYSPAWLDLGSDGGELYGIFYKVSSKATVWYAPPAFAAAGYTVPATWDDMVALADTMVADGHTPFSLVAPKVPGGGGWALTDWVSQLVLGGCGPSMFDEWVAGRLPWTDACIRQAFERFITIVHTPGYVLGGAERILTTGDAEGSYPMYTEPPTAWMYNMASFAQAFIATRFPQLAAGDDYAFFPFPAVAPDDAGSVTIGADVVVMLHDTPAARAFMSYLAGADSQQAWIELGGFTSVNRSVPADAYADPVALAVAQQLESAQVVRFGAGDSMPAAVQQAWWKGMLQLVDDPTTLDTVLESLTEAATGAAPADDPQVATAGDIACSPSDSSFGNGAGTATSCRQMAVSQLVVDGGYAAFLGLGDLQYDSGVYDDFLAGYDPSFGRVKSITHPAPGNHEYGTDGADGYYRYFGAAAGDPATGYYSYDIGAWHLVALNSNCSAVSCSAGSEQQRWLRADLAAHPTKCALVYWHHPRFSSGSEHGDSPGMAALYQAAYDGGVDVALAGHDHHYERFALQDANGTADANGIREFVVGSGGRSHYAMGSIQPNSQAHDNSTFGVLALTLHPGSYDWQFVAEAGGTYTDSGTQACH